MPSLFMLLGFITLILQITQLFNYAYAPRRVNSLLLVSLLLAAACVCVCVCVRACVCVCTFLCYSSIADQVDNYNY